MSREILIIGSGFMGTSLAHALENCNISCLETHEAYLATLKNLNIYKNIFSDVSDIKEEFDLIIICTRQKDVLEHLFHFSSKFPESLITDISSSKNFLQEVNLPSNFISSHPICGSHKVGPKDAEPDLYKGKEVIIIDTPNQENLPRLRSFWNSLGANTTVMSFSEHDKNYGLLSHFPHLFSFLYREILDEENIDYKKFSGDSLKEILRLSEANKHLWNEIFLDNKDNLEHIKEKLKKKLL
jgi:prephenate dehydrogenase